MTQVDDEVKHSRGAPRLRVFTTNLARHVLEQFEVLANVDADAEAA